LTKESAVLAAYTFGQALWTIVIFLLWIGFIGVGLWLLVRLFRNTNFLIGHRASRIAVKVLLVVFTIFIPVLGVPVLFGIWYSTRSRDVQLLDTFGAGPEVPPRSRMPSADQAPYHRPLPFPAPSESAASDPEREATESPPPFE
jgi:hypothetical protein